MITKEWESDGLYSTVVPPRRGAQGIPTRMNPVLPMHPSCFLGVNYCIVRPTGLNDNWPSGSRPIFSQGDVAVGRIHRRDVAKVMCDALNTPHACQKTFEVLSLAGYPPARSTEPIFERLVTDTQGLTEDQVEANFALLQQLLPGEVQDASKLAMGQTYEQLDAGKTGRLGERGKEDAEAAAPKPTTNGQ